VKVRIARDGDERIESCVVEILEKAISKDRDRKTAGKSRIAP
jgi:hypothetical protein